MTAAIPLIVRLQRLAPLLVPAVLAVVLRLPHLDWGLPAIEEEALPAKKAIEMWGFAEGSGACWTAGGGGNSAATPTPRPLRF